MSEELILYKKSGFFVKKYFYQLEYRIMKFVLFFFFSINCLAILADDNWVSLEKEVAKKSAFSDLVNTDPNFTNVVVPNNLFKFFTAKDPAGISVIDFAGENELSNNNVFLYGELRIQKQNDSDSAVRFYTFLQKVDLHNGLKHVMTVDKLVIRFEFQYLAKLSQFTELEKIPISVNLGLEYMDLEDSIFNYKVSRFELTKRYFNRIFDGLTHGDAEKGPYKFLFRLKLIDKDILTELKMNENEN